MNSSQDETFRSLVDYFTGRRIRILTSIEPSYIRVGIGSSASLSLGNAKGDVAVYIGKRDGGSSINFNFDFSKDYSVSLIVAIFGALIVYTLLTWVASNMIREVGSVAWPYIFPFLLFLAVLTFAIIIVMESYSVSLTRRRFVEELNMFAQSLSAKNK